MNPKKGTKIQSTAGAPSAPPPPKIFDMDTIGLDIIHEEKPMEGAEKDLVNFPPPNSMDNSRAIPIPWRHVMDYFGDDFIEICVTFCECNRLRYKEPTLSKMVEDALYLASQKRKCKPVWFLIGEFSKVGNFHFHGMIKNHNGAFLAMIKRILNRTCGRTKINMVRFPESYKKYIFKDYNENLPHFLFSHYIIYNKFNGLQENWKEKL